MAQQRPQAELAVLAAQALATVRSRLAQAQSLPLQRKPRQMLLRLVPIQA